MENRENKSPLHVRSDIHAVSVNIEISDKKILYILLAADGTINRTGDGTLENKDPEIYIGKTDEELFKKLLDCISDDVLINANREFNLYNEGTRVKLELRFYGNNMSAGYRFHYTLEEKDVIPTEIFYILIKATELTENWYQSQKHTVN